MDGYTIGLFILALYIINKIIELSLTATIVVVVAAVFIGSVMKWVRRKRKPKSNQK